MKTRLLSVPLSALIVGALIWVGQGVITGDWSLWITRG